MQPEGPSLRAHAREVVGVVFQSRSQTDKKADAHEEDKGRNGDYDGVERTCRRRPLSIGEISERRHRLEACELTGSGNLLEHNMRRLWEQGVVAFVELKYLYNSVSLTKALVDQNETACKITSAKANSGSTATLPSTYGKRITHV